MPNRVKFRAKMQHITNELAQYSKLRTAITASGILGLGMRSNPTASKQANPNAAAAMTKRIEDGIPAGHHPVARRRAVESEVIKAPNRSRSNRQRGS